MNDAKLDGAELHFVWVTPKTCWTFVRLLARDGSIGDGEASLLGEEDELTSVAERLLPSALPADPSKRMASEDGQAVFGDIHTQMIRRYPKLANVAIEAAWGGPMAMTKNSAPLITALGDHENVTLAIIGNGNGIGLGSNAGALVKGMVMGKDSLDVPTRAFLEYCGG